MWLIIEISYCYNMICALDKFNINAVSDFVICNGHGF